MIVGIHQPQYIPWPPYLLKMLESDVFIFLDSVDFQKNGLQNRNQIKTAQGTQWLTVPVKQRLGQRISEVQIDNSTDWRRKHRLAIAQNYRKAKAFDACSDDLDVLFASEWTSLSDLNIHVISLMLKWMGVERPALRSSRMQATGKASDLVLNLCREVGGKTYLSGMGGRDYLDEAAFRDAGIEIVYRPPVMPVEYKQLNPGVGFLDSLSALDLIFNAGSHWRDYMPVNRTTL